MQLKKKKKKANKVWTKLFLPKLKNKENISAKCKPKSELSLTKKLLKNKPEKL